MPNSSYNAIRESQIQSTKVLQQSVSKPLVLSTKEEWKIQTSKYYNKAK
jgi:hypothetical protein